MQGFPPDRHRLPRWLRWPATPLIGRPWRLQVAYRGGAGRPEHIAFAPGAQLVTKPGVTTQFIVTHHPAMRDLRAPQVEYFQALLLPGVVVYLLGHMAGVAPVGVPCPRLRQRQAEVEQGMVVARHIPHEDTHLAVIDFAAVAAPLTFHPHRMRAPLREAAGIKGDHTIGLPQLLDHLSNQDLDQI